MHKYRFRYELRKATQNKIYICSAKIHFILDKYSKRSI